MNYTLPEKHDCPGLERFGRNTKHLQSDISAKLNDEYQNEKTTLGQVKEKVLSKHGGESSEKDRPQKEVEEALRDSSPDVATDGSLVHKDSELDKELDRIRREAKQNRSSGNIGLSAKIWGKRLKTLLFDLRFWLLLVLTAVVGANQLGYFSLLFGSP